jgi:hypothetical protein
MGRSAAATKSPVDRDAEGRWPQSRRTASPVEARVPGVTGCGDGEAPTRPSPNGVEPLLLPQSRTLR